MGATMKKLPILSILFILIMTLLCFSFVACNPQEPLTIDYAQENNFEVSINTIDATYDEDSNLTNRGYMVFEPKLDGTGYQDVKFGLIFYLGTFMKPELYTYIGNALAKQGYVAVFYNAPFAYAQYEVTEKAFEMYPNVKFFVGGHSQGGGAAIRRAMECEDIVKGAILLDPMAFRHQLLDENGEPMQNEYGVDIYINDSLKDTNMPAIFIKAQDQAIIKDSDRETALDRMNDSVLIHDLGEGSTHAAFAEMESGKEQRDEIITCILAFMQSVILG